MYNMVTICHGNVMYSMVSPVINTVYVEVAKRIKVFITRKKKFCNYEW